MPFLPINRSRTASHTHSALRFISVLLVTALVGLALRQVPVRAINPPVAYDQSVSTDEDTARAITLNADDEDGEPLTFAIVTQPGYGSLSGTPPDVTYTPNANYNGSDSFTFRANDGDQDSNLATVSIIITAVNDAPTASNQLVTAAEDTPRAITLNATDIDGDSLTFAIVAQPTAGTLSGTPPNVTYTPDANYNGADSFTFRANDGTLNSNTATVTLSIAAVEDVPVALPQSVATPPDTPVAITLRATDGDGDPLTYIVVTGTTDGILGGTAPNLTYTPNAGFVGTDSLTFQANDGDQNSNTATVTINVDSPPVANAQTVDTDEDTDVAIVLTASDPEGDPLTYAIVAQPAYGTLSGSPPNVTYAPNANYNGPDNFTFRANDGDQDSNIATVAITVQPVEDVPVAYNQAVTADEDTPTEIVLSAQDGDGDALVYTLDTLPTYGSVSGTLPNVTYRPNLNYNGLDSFTFHVNDGGQDSNVATVSITVQPVNDPPVASSQTVQTDEDTPIQIVLGATDVDGDALSFEVLVPPTNGTLSGTPPQLTYTPDPNYNGSDIFGFRANDGTTTSETAWISIGITPVNDPPIANGDNVDVDEDSFVGITLTATDVDDLSLTYSIAVQPMNGTLTGTPPDVLYTPNGDFYGAESFTFGVEDTEGLTDTAQVEITVINQNDDPLATDDRATIREDSTDVPINVIYNDDYLPDPFETLTIVSVTDPPHGGAAIQASGSRVAYTPDTDYYGPDSFNYTIQDGNGGTATATVRITVTNQNDSPLARPDDASMNEDGGAIEIDVTDNDTYLPDPPEDLTIVGISDAPHGRVTINYAANSLTYTPDANYFGTDTFTYSITDNNGGYGTTLVRVQVNSVNDAPVADDDSASTAEDVPVTVDVLANDLDIDSDLDPASVRVVHDDRPDHGTTKIDHNTGRITYDPAPDWSGIDTFTYSVCDGETPALCDEALVEIAVGSVNDPPVSDAGDDQSVDTQTRVTLDGSGSYDPDGNYPLGYQWSRVSGPPVILTDSQAESPSFIAPDDPCVLVFALIVEDSEHKVDGTPDRVTITVNNQPPVSNAGPDKIAQVDSLIILNGSASTDPDGDLPLAFRWTQSGGPTVSLSDSTSPSPTFTAPSSAAVLTFTLFVTDAFDEPDPTPDEVVVTVSEPFYIYLPTISARHMIAPDLVVESVVATPRNVTVVIKNQGDAAVKDPFWLDVYINPSRPPTAVNETFDDLGTQGLAWAVTKSGLSQLVPGGTLTLRLNDAFYDPDISVFPNNLLPGTPIYAQVDSFNPSTGYGTVLEKHEAIGEPYNNIYGPVLSQKATALGSELPPAADSRPKPQELPERR